MTENSPKDSLTRIAEERLRSPFHVKPAILPFHPDPYPHHPDTNPYPGWRDYDPGPVRPIREAPITIGSYISTVIDNTPPLKVGEEWYIRYPGAKALTHVEIVDLTPKTVQLKSLGFYDHHGSRYEKKDIDFVERCKAVE